MGKFCKSYRMRCREGLGEGFDFRNSSGDGFLEFQERFLGSCMTFGRESFGRFHRKLREGSREVQGRILKNCPVNFVSNVVAIPAGDMIRACFKCFFVVDSFAMETDVVCFRFGRTRSFGSALSCNGFRGLWDSTGYAGIRKKLTWCNL